MEEVLQETIDLSKALKNKLFEFDKKLSRVYIGFIILILLYFATLIWIIAKL